MAHGVAAKSGAVSSAGGRDPRYFAPPPRSSAFDAAEFDELSEMIGEDGVLEMVEIFETDTRQRLRRLAAGGQDLPTQVREMHTLKGAAGTVAAPRLAELGRTFERAARNGISPEPDDIKAIEPALEDYLKAVRAWSKRRELVSAV